MLTEISWATIEVPRQRGASITMYVALSEGCVVKHRACSIP